MTHARGTVLGGIRTVEDLRDRCRIDEETGCWHWGLAIVRGAPHVSFVDADGKRRRGTGRNAAAALGLEGGVPDGHVAFARACCPSSDCVNPLHTRTGTRRQKGEAIVRTGEQRGLPSKAIPVSASNRRRQKLTPDQVEAIRSSTDTQTALAARYGVSQTTIWAIVSGRRYRPQAYSAFSLGPACNDDSARKTA